MRKIARHLTYANVMSSLAVFGLLGGAGAFAAQKQTQKIGTTQLKASAVTTAKLKNGAVANAKLAAGAVSTDKLADGAVTNSKLAEGSVSTGKLAGDAVTGDKVNEASLGEVPSANSANPAVFARVNANGVVDAANSKGLTSPNVSKVGTGVYCISVPSFTPRGGQVTTQAGATATSAQIGVAGSGPSCGGAVQISTFNVTGVATDLTFYVELYR
jgi:hypothetical protein